MNVIDRAALLAIVGVCDRRPTEAMLEELERALEALRREGIYGGTDREVLDTVRARRLVELWKLRHGLRA
jgi:hypothetical protein